MVSLCRPVFSRLSRFLFFFLIHPKNVCDGLVRTWLGHVEIPSSYGHLYQCEVWEILDSRLSEGVFGSFVIGILSFLFGNKWSKKSLIKATKSNGEAKGRAN